MELVRAPEFSKATSSFPLDLDERVVSMITANIDFPSTEIVPGLHPHRQQHHGVIIVGTCSVDAQGEDAPSRGRILVFKVEHNPDPTLSKEDCERYHKQLGRPATKPTLKQIASVELRGPISALGTIDGKILAATGNLPCSVKLLELNSRNEGLIPIGFYDAPTCVVSINVIRDEFVLLADMNKSIHFIRWKDRQFTCLGKSFDSIRVFSSEFLVDSSRLVLCAADDDANIRLWHYDPEAQDLHIRSELNIGCRVVKVKTKRVAPLPPKQDDSSLVISKANSSDSGLRWVAVFGTLSGGLSAVLPIEEKVYRRLELLQKALIESPMVYRNAGLHPLQCAIPKGSRKLQKNKTTFIVDGRILWRFVDLEKVSQRKIAMSIGSIVETILDTLLEIELQTSW